MIIHFLHHPVSAKRFVEPIVGFLCLNKIRAELWTEPRTDLAAFIKTIDCPHRFEWFDLSLNLIKVMTRLIRIWYRLKRLRPAVIHSHQTRGATIPLIAAFAAGVPIRIYHNHGTPYLGYRGFLRFLLWLLEYINCFFATHIVTVSDFIKTKMLCNHITSENKLRLIGAGSACGIDLCEFDSTRFSVLSSQKARQYLNLPHDAFVVLYVGRPHKRKGFDSLIKVWISADFNNENCVLLMAGCSQIDVYEITGGKIAGIRALGYVTDTLMLYAACDIVVLPSAHEGFPYALLEGAAAGKPLIGTENTGASSIVIPGQTGILVPCNDASALIKAINELRNNPKLRILLGKNAREYVEKYYDRRLVLNELREYYKQIGIS